MSISWKNLPLRNLKGYPGRTAALILFAALMTVAVFGGTLLIQGVRQGIQTTQSRLGADIMVIPESAKNDFDAQTVLTHAEPSYFYMDASVCDQVVAVDGVEKVSPQLFLASAKAGCCSARLQIIAFDPETDFTIQPWIKDTNSSLHLGTMDVILGSNVTAYDDFRLYDCRLNMAAQFAPTGSTLDNAVYANFDTIRQLMQASLDKGMNRYADMDPDGVISSVMVKVGTGRDVSQVADDIRESVAGVTVIPSSRMISGIEESLSRISQTVTVMIGAIWLICLLMILLIFSLMITERQREFASLQAVGACKQMISGVVAKEAIFVTLAGGAVGIALSCLILLPFAGFISQSLNVGFLVPSIGRILILATIALGVLLVSGLLAALLGMRKIGRMDASLILKEGE